MMKLVCEKNNMEWAGKGWLQCCRRADCPKEINKRILGYDCFTFIDNIPPGAALVAVDDKTITDIIRSSGIEHTISIPPGGQKGIIEAHKKV